MRLGRKQKFVIFLAGVFLFTGISANAFGFKSKNKSSKPTRAESVLNETLNQSVIKNNYKSGSKVEKIEDGQEVNVSNEPLIEGSVSKNLELNLDDCLKLALGNNPKIRSALNSALATHAKINQAWSEYFPKLQFQTGVEREKALRASRAVKSEAFTSYLMGDISASQLIYDFGYTQNEVTIYKLSYEQAKTNLTSVINEVVYEVKNDYYKLLLAIEKERVARDTVNKYDMFYKQAKAFYEIGTNPKIDVTIAEVNLSNAKLNLIQCKNEVDSAMATLNDAMGLPELGKYKVKDKLHYSPVKITFEDAVTIAKQSRPDYKMAELKVKQAHQEVKLAKKSYFPTIEGEAGFREGGYEFGGSSGYNYGVYLKFPVVNGMLVANQISEAKALYDKEIAEAEATRNEIHLEIHDAYLRLDVKQHQIPVTSLQVKQAKENYDLSYGRYTVGVGNPIELKDAENAYQEARVTYYQTLYDFNSAKADLERAIGRNIVGSEYDSIDLKTENSVKNQIYNNNKFRPKDDKIINLSLKKNKTPAKKDLKPEQKPLVPAVSTQKQEAKKVSPKVSTKSKAVVGKKPSQALRPISSAPKKTNQAKLKPISVKVKPIPTPKK